MPKKILVIEDDKFLRKVIDRKLLGEGYEVVEATDGSEGVRAAEDSKPDLILLDLVLPEISGFGVLTQLKASLATKNIPVIILSNLGEREDVEKGFSLGAADYLIKSHFNPGEIVEKIEAVFNKDSK